MNVRTMATTMRQGTWGAGAWPWIAALLALAVFGFWKPYFSRMPDAEMLTHAHVALMVAWFGLLMVQPWLIRSRRRPLHRMLGRTSFVLVPAIVATAALLAQHRFRVAPPEAFVFQAYVMFLGLATAALFAGFWSLAMIHRRDPALHARYMVGTALTMIDPALVRVLLFWVPPTGVQDLQWITYGTVYAILLVLIFVERRQARGRSAFPVMLGLFALLHLLAANFAGSATWHAFVRWFAAA